MAVLPAYQEEETVGAVVSRIPASVHGRPTATIVVDDGSTDATAARAAAAGATVVSHGTQRASGPRCAAGWPRRRRCGRPRSVYLDADGEYFPRGHGRRGPRAGRIGRLRRRVPVHRGDPVDAAPSPRGQPGADRGVRWVARRPDLTDGQSGYRAFSLEATAAEVVHDYNYAQVLTLDLLSKGFTYTEVPIRYRFEPRVRRSSASARTCGGCFRRCTGR